MSFQLFSRRSLFGPLFGAAAVLFGAGRSVAAEPIAESGDAGLLEGVTYYSYDERGRLICVDERWAPCDESPAIQPPPPVTSWTYDEALGSQHGTG